MSKKKKQKLSVGDVVRFITTSPLEIHFGVIMDITDDNIAINIFPETLDDTDDMYNDETDAIALVKTYPTFDAKKFEKLVIKNYGKHIVLITPEITTWCSTRHGTTLCTPSPTRDNHEAYIVKDLLKNPKSEGVAKFIKSCCCGYDGKEKIYLMIDNIPYRVKIKHDNVFIDGRMI